MKFIKLLKKLKQFSTHPVHQMSCVISKGNQIISVGYNKNKTHTHSPHKYKFLHAEIVALLDNKFADLNGCTIYIYRETRDGVPAISKPCPSCMEAIRLAGIKKICYSINGTFKEERVL